MNTKFKTLSALAAILCPLALSSLAAQTTRTVIENNFDTNATWDIPNFTATTAALPWSTENSNNVGIRETITNASYTYRAALPETIELKNVGDSVSISLDAVFTGATTEFKLGFAGTPSGVSTTTSVFQGLFRAETGKSHQVGYLPDWDAVYNNRKFGTNGSYVPTLSTTIYKLEVRLEMTATGLNALMYIDGAKQSEFLSQDMVSVAGSYLVSHATFQLGNSASGTVGLQIDNIKVTTNVAAPIPEPSTIALLAGGVVLLLAGLARHRFRRA
ncbi:PEP-CTERM putative exosortase interaction domain-containing protein [Opitutaceae bacterium TAV1]|nr:PEP-CTERM putative exosortase interaction domain-containing protein [Opitutaceae bacterium TAV1]